MAGSIGGLLDKVSFSIISLDVAMTVISDECLTEVHEAWGVELSAVSHPVLLVPLFGHVEDVSFRRLVNGSSITPIVHQSKLGEGSLILGGHHWRLSQVLKSHVWVQIRNDVLTHGRSHEHLFVVHARVSEHHVPMVLGVEVSELN